MTLLGAVASSADRVLMDASVGRTYPVLGMLTGLGGADELGRRQWRHVTMAALSNTRPLPVTAWSR